MRACHCTWAADSVTTATGPQQQAGGRGACPAQAGVLGKRDTEMPFSCCFGAAAWDSSIPCGHLGESQLPFLSPCEQAWESS